MLKAEDLGSIGYGTPIYFRRLQVGSVTAFELDKDGGGVTIRIFVNAPYNGFVKTGSRFWHASGIDVSLSAEGISVDTESVASLMVGGLAFGTPPFAKRSGTAPPSSVFKLYANRASALREPDDEGMRFALVFSESVRGLEPGAAVEFRGIPIGEVNEISTRYVASRERIQISVHITIYPDRLRRLSDRKGPISAEERRANMDKFVAAGLRAQLRMGNLITGQPGRARFR
jgi:paraquat-inducible protein B